MKALKRSVMSVLVLSLFLFVVPVFAVLGDDVDQNITTEKSEASKSLNICNDHQIRCSIIISFLLVFYLVVLLVGRVFWVAIPNNEYLKTHADLIKVRLKVESDLPDSDPNKDKIVEIEKYLKKVRERLEGSMWTSLLAFTGKQMSAWRALHEAERLAIDFYSTEVVKDQAIAVLDKLRKTQSTTTTLEAQLQKRLDDNENNLQKHPDGNGNNLKELVKEAKAILYQDKDAQFELLADTQNKALWLVLTTVLILLGLFWLFPKAQILFLAGATGGLLMRLRTVVKTRALPFDYGVSWTVLFLAPLVGALTGWAGTLLFVLLQSWGLIGEKFALISIIDPTYATLMVAIVFGFSAVLFEKFVEQLEESISKK